MILSNIEILDCIKKGLFSISTLTGNENPSENPFNTSAIDLRLGNEVLVPDKAPIALDLRSPGIAKLLNSISKKVTITEVTPYALKRGEFVLMSTVERVKFPLNQGDVSYGARVEGKSSIARCGILVHFTAPTIHGGFEGPITLEILNLGPNDFLLSPNMYICQLIIEEIKGCPIRKDSQFQGQNTPAGNIEKN